MIGGASKITYARVEPADETGAAIGRVIEVALSVSGISVAGLPAVANGAIKYSAPDAKVPI